MSTLDVREELSAMQSLFLPTSSVSEAVRANARTFWHNQDKVIDSMQSFANGWFERRHAGARAALEAAERMCEATTPIDLLREYQDWASGSFQRVMADGLACQQQMAAAIGVLDLSLTAARDKSPERVKFKAPHPADAKAA